MRTYLIREEFGGFLQHTSLECRLDPILTAYFRGHLLLILPASSSDEVFSYLSRSKGIEVPTNL